MSEELKQDLKYNNSSSTPTLNTTEKPADLYGWICPKCGAVISPYESYCPNCTMHNFDITCTTSETPTLQSQLKSDFNVYKFVGGRKDGFGYE